MSKSKCFIGFSIVFFFLTLQHGCTDLAPISERVVIELFFADKDVVIVEGEPFTLCVAMEAVAFVEQVSISSEGTPQDTTITRFKEDRYRDTLFITMHFDSPGSSTISAVAQTTDGSTKSTILDIEVFSIAPEIVAHPEDVSVLEGDSAVFKFTAEGSKLEFQWQENGENIEGATLSELAIRDITSAHNGNFYSCVVSNALGTDTTSAALLTVVYRVIYNSSEHDKGEVPIDTNLYQMDQAVNILSNTGELKRGGFTFIGWIVGLDTSVVYNFGDILTMGEETVNLNALWIKDHVITFDPQNGDETFSVGVASGFTVDEPDVPQRTNYKFVGWYSDEELTELWDFSTPITEDNTLYVKWETISVVDTTAPVITIVGGTEILHPVFEPFTPPEFSAYDNYDGDLTSKVTITGEVDTTKLGTYKLVYSVSDSAGNQTSIKVTVTVFDNTAPVITITGGTEILHPVFEPFTPPEFSAYDNYDGDLTSKVTITGEVDTAKLGTYELVYSVSNTSGKNTSRKVTISVVDTTAPIITIIGDTEILHHVFEPFTPPEISAYDNYDGDLTNKITVTGDVDTTSLGIYELVYSVADSSGNQASRKVIVTVIDTIAPVISLPSDTENPLTVAHGKPFTPPAAVATDNYEGDITGKVIVNGTVDTLKVGTYEISYIVADISGNACTLVLVVHVVDSTPPIIYLNGNNPETVILGGAQYSDPGAYAEDNVDGIIPFTKFNVVGTVDINSVGTYTLTYNVSDNAGNAADPVVRTVLVADQPDTIPPVIVINNGKNRDTVYVNDQYTLPPATAFDNKDGLLPPEAISVYPETASTEEPGLYEFVYSAQDAAGNIGRDTLFLLVRYNTTGPALSISGYNAGDTITLDEGAQLTFTVMAVPAVDGDQIVFGSAEALPENAVLDNNTGSFSYTPCYDLVSKSENVRYFPVVFTGRGGIPKAETSQLPIVIKVRHVNRPPEIKTPPVNTSAALGKSVTVPIEIYDPDGDVITVTASSPFTSQVVYNQTQNSITFSSTLSQSEPLGSKRINLVVSDGTVNDTLIWEVTLTTWDEWQPVSGFTAHLDTWQSSMGNINFPYSHLVAKDSTTLFHGKKEDNPSKNVRFILEKVTIANNGTASVENNFVVTRQYRPSGPTGSATRGWGMGNVFLNGANVIFSFREIGPELRDFYVLRQNNLSLRANDTTTYPDGYLLFALPSTTNDGYFTIPKYIENGQANSSKDLPLTPCFGINSPNKQVSIAFSGTSSVYRKIGNGSFSHEKTHNQGDWPHGWIRRASFGAADGSTFYIVNGSNELHRVDNVLTAMTSSRITISNANMNQLRLEDVSMLSDDIGWVIDNDGNVWGTRDGFESRSFISTGIPNDTKIIRIIISEDRKAAFAVSETGALFRWH
ncbi:Peptidoglycan N-acetylglucosamine deacetylase [Chitinispirillum alkaliphilum]|nr:Peptidoglycan N-acetylglucosamine deacetylase [Chitinispirillum alkaliphilum]